MKPFIFGLEGPTLTPHERRFFHHSNPCGFILFGRNIESEEQVKNLIKDLKDVVGRDRLPILVDCEGGRVFRFPEDMHVRSPAARTFGDLYQMNPEAGVRSCYENYYRLSIYLYSLGISVNCAPVLDLHVKGASPVMGERTFSSDPEVVFKLGKAAVRGMQDAGVVPVIKHIPGHGAARQDSHLTRPRIELSEQELASHLTPFQKMIASPNETSVPLWAMTAHIVYTAFDDREPATLSPTVIQKVVRTQLGFQGVVVSDDMVMGAVSQETPLVRTQKAFSAGCDILIFGAGTLSLYAEALEGGEPLSPKICQKMSIFLS